MVQLLGSILPLVNPSAFKLHINNSHDVVLSSFHDSIWEPLSPDDCVVFTSYCSNFEVTRVQLSMTPGIASPSVLEQAFATANST